MARTRQPQGPIQINKGSPLAVGLVAHFHAPSLTINGIGPTFNTGSIQAGTSGLGVDYDAGTVTSFAQTYGTGPALVTASGASFAVLFDVDVLEDYGAILAIEETTTTCVVIEARLGTGATNSKVNIVRSTGTSGHYQVYDTGADRFAAGDKSQLLIITFPDAQITSAPSVWAKRVKYSTASVGGNGTGAVEAGGGGGVKFGSRPDGATKFDGRIYGAWFWNRPLADAEALKLYDNVWQLFASPRRPWIQLGAASGGTGATGTSAATLESVTGAAAGTLALAAASAATLGAVTGTAAGAAAIAGTSAQSLAETTGTAAATLAIAATSADTLAATVGTAAGTLAIAATSAQALGAVTGTANGTTLGAASGTSAATLANTTGTAAGTLALAATSSATVGIVTGTSAGTISVGGASAQALSDVTGVAVGNTTGATNGVSIVTLDSVSGSAAGYADILATSAGALEAISGTAAGQILIAGSSAGTLGAVTGGVAPPPLPAEAPDSSRLIDRDPARLGASRIGPPAVNRDDYPFGTPTPSQRRPRLG